MSRQWVQIQSDRPFDLIQIFNTHALTYQAEGGRRQPPNAIYPSTLYAPHNGISPEKA